VRRIYVDRSTSVQLRCGRMCFEKSPILLLLLLCLPPSVQHLLRDHHWDPLVARRLGVDFCFFSDTVGSHVIIRINIIYVYKLLATAVYVCTKQKKYTRPTNVHIYYVLCIKKKKNLFRCICVRVYSYSY